GVVTKHLAAQSGLRTRFAKRTRARKNFRFGSCLGRNCSRSGHRAEQETSGNRGSARSFAIKALGKKRIKLSLDTVIPSAVENGAAGEAATWTGRPEVERTGSERIKSRRGPISSFAESFDSAALRSG